MSLDKHEGVIFESSHVKLRVNTQRDRKNDRSKNAILSTTVEETQAICKPYLQSLRIGVCEAELASSRDIRPLPRFLLTYIKKKIPRPVVL